LGTDDREASFRTFVEQTEPRLRRALTAAYGYERGREATAEALAFAWENWDAMQNIENIPGYLYRVGQSRTRTRKIPLSFEEPTTQDPLFEPGLIAAIASLSERQRVAVFLAHGEGWTHAEVAQLLGIKEASVQKHVERGIAHLRRALVSRRVD